MLKIQVIWKIATLNYTKYRITSSSPFDQKLKTVRYLNFYMLLEESTCALRCTLKHVNGIPLFSRFGTNVIRLPELKNKFYLLFYVLEMPLPLKAI